MLAVLFACRLVAKFRRDMFAAGQWASEYCLWGNDTSANIYTGLRSQRACTRADCEQVIHEDWHFDLGEDLVQQLRAFEDASMTLPM